MKKNIVISGLLAASLLPGLAFSATQNTNLNATATVPAVCNFAGVSNIAFGSYDPTSATPTDSNGSVDIRCTKNTLYEVIITGARTMLNGGDSLAFELYSNFAGGAVWSNAFGTGVTNTPLTNLPTTHTIYGRVPALQDVPAGAYAGTVTITVQY
ncbi:MAG: hypothetical protein A2V90_05750 [Gammaproteobacteria bacterium RBG_16_57_12]|nr:MAG: hypothetical protein A2V90_05750 [Gammaproteobacteria bacterium RBG_16_57_12]